MILRAPGPLNALLVLAKGDASYTPQMTVRTFLEFWHGLKKAPYARMCLMQGKMPYNLN